MLSSIIKSVIGGNAAKKAASIQDRAAQAAADRSMAQYEQTRTDFQPYREAGEKATGRLSDLLGISGKTGAEGYGSLGRDFTMQDFQQDPGYGFRFDEGMKALERSQAAKGGLFSGQAMKESQRFGQGLASQEYGAAFDRFNQNKTNLFNRFSNLSSQGQNAAAQVGQFGANATSSANDYRTSGATARSAGVMGNANSWINGITEIENNAKMAAGMSSGMPMGGGNNIQWGTGLNRNNVGGNANNPDNWKWR